MPWPEIRFERRYGQEWVAVVPAPEVLASAPNRATWWKAYLEFTPMNVREFVALFRTNRLTALQVAANCPELVGTLLELPALLPWIAAHAILRGYPAPRWHEVNAVFERGGVFALLEWLGLPASHATLAILRNLVSPELPVSLLEPLRKVLWAPQGVFALAQMPAITPADLDDACHALAA
jgi:hypothetical protein